MRSANLHCRILTWGGVGATIWLIAWRVVGPGVKWNVPATASGFEITSTELRGWILHEDDRLLVIDKPALVLCHPSKNGPWSSLIGACRDYTGLATLHMPSRLDRETSGVVVFAKDREMGSMLQRAIEHRQVKKSYMAIVKGVFTEPVTVDQPIGLEGSGVVHIRQWVRPDGAAAVTAFEPRQWREGYTLVDVRPFSGRMHQIRVHAAWLGHPIVGDKIYGPDPQFFQSLQAIGDEPRADHVGARHARAGEFDQRRFGIRLQPLGAPEARLEGD